MRKGKAMEIMRKSKLKSFDLLKLLQSELTHELSSSPCFQNEANSPPENFTVEWDEPHAQDVVLRKKCESGEEVAVSAVLGSDLLTEDNKYPRGVLMKVCVTKPGLSSFLQFDCGVSNVGPNFDILSARYHQSTTSIGSKYYTGPIFRDVDPQLQDALREYLKDRGIGESLMKYLVIRMHNKEQNQYTNWLRKLQQTVS